MMNLGAKTCPICKNMSLLELKYEPGVKHMLCQYNTNNNSIEMGNGLIVDTMGCTSCGAIFLKNTALIGQKADS